MVIPLFVIVKALARPYQDCTGTPDKPTEKCIRFNANEAFAKAV
ncbi:hypothetical protein [Halopseudomonas phragmitis]